MRLDEYQWSHNPRGIHNVRVYMKPNLDRYVQTKMGWIKLVAGSDEYVREVPSLIAAGITPIIRIYHPKWGAQPPTDDQRRFTANYIGAGVRWLEMYNEPNLGAEWPDVVQPDFSKTDAQIAPLMTNWLLWAEDVIGMGGYPAFPALSETVGTTEDGLGWLNAMLNYLASAYYDRFRAVAANGLWCATHPYFYNHFYQEAGSATSARGPGEQNGSEGGWHFEYPYDPISQRSDPGRSALGGTPSAPNGDPVGLIGMGTVFMQRFQELFGGNVVPVVGTEGGITPFPAPGAPPVQADKRYPGFDWRSQGEATLACFNWITNQAPPWMLGLTLWKEDDYWSGKGPAAAVQRLSESPPVLKTVPSLEALSGPGPGPLGTPAPGPGKVHGTPDLHFLYIAPEFSAGWFLDAARAYWDRFRPVVITALDLIDGVPGSKSLAVTLLTPGAKEDLYRKAIKDRGPNILIDSIAADTIEAFVGTLGERVQSGQRFGK